MRLKALQKLKTGVCYSSDNLSDVMADTRPVWMIATSEFFHMQPSELYVVLDIKTIEQAGRIESKGRHGEEVFASQFLAFCQKLIRINRHRAILGLRSILVLSPPSLRKIVHYEFALAQAGFSVAWIDKSSDSVADESDFRINPKLHKLNDAKHIDFFRLEGPFDLMLRSLEVGDALEVDLAIEPNSNLSAQDFIKLYRQKTTEFCERNVGLQIIVTRSEDLSGVVFQRET